MNNISLSCEEIQTPDGFVFKLPSDSLNQTLNGECEEFWYSGDRCVADPSNPHKLMYPVTSVSSDHLVTSRCVNLIHEIICDESRWRMETVFRVRNETAATPNSDVLDEVTPSVQLSDQLWWLLALFILLLIIILICLKLRKKIFRCFQKEAQIIGQHASENRDPESSV